METRRKLELSWDIYINRVLLQTKLKYKRELFYAMIAVVGAFARLIFSRVSRLENQKD
jgi:hypothetical protein